MAGASGVQRFAISRLAEAASRRRSSDCASGWRTQAASNASFSVAGRSGIGAEGGGAQTALAASDNRAQPKKPRARNLRDIRFSGERQPHGGIGGVRTFGSQDETSGGNQALPRYQTKRKGLVPPPIRQGSTNWGVRARKGAPRHVHHGAKAQTRLRRMRPAEEAARASPPQNSHGNRRNQRVPPPPAARTICRFRRHPMRRDAGARGARNAEPRRQSHVGNTRSPQPSRTAAAVVPGRESRSSASRRQL